jgi:pSer/pThr/pTyr-binding forkhead associated (FHA) protein
MATRLYDLDFAGAGEIDLEGADAIVDFPEKTGKISYRKLWLKDGKMRGYMLLGERAEAVRKKGRLYKRLIDEGIDVGPIRERLLERAFDLAAWLKPMENEKPAPPSTTSPGPHVTSSAKMRGTQALSLSDLPKFMAGLQPEAAPPTQASPGAAVTPNSPQAMPQQRAARPGTSILVMDQPPAPAYLEAGGRRTEIGQRCVIGTARDCQIILQDPSVSDAHAQITRHAHSIYLRDLGSTSGTWVNQKPVSTPVELKNGDHVRIGSSVFVFRMDTGTRTSIPATSLPSMSLPPIAEGPRLIVRSGSGIGLTFAVGSGRTTIGRSHEATVRLDDPSIAPMHAALELAGGAVNIAPMQAAVVLRGVPIAQGQWTHAYEGDVIQIGGVALEYASKSTQNAAVSMPGARS